MKPHELKAILPFLELPLIEVLLDSCSILEIEKGQEVIKQSGFIPGIPIVLNGLIQVATQKEDRSFLLYYIEQGQSCVMSFSSCLNGTPSRVSASALEDTKALLVPIDKIKIWLRQYPSINTLFYNQYESRYADLLDNIEQLLFEKLDMRLYKYLKKKTKTSENKNVKITHQEIANDLATAREVISRTLKKLESEGLINHSKSGIQVL